MLDFSLFNGFSSIKFSEDEFFGYVSMCKESGKVIWIQVKLYVRDYCLHRQNKTVEWLFSGAVSAEKLSVGHVVYYFCVSCLS